MAKKKKPFDLMPTEPKPSCQKYQKNTELGLGMG